jgi:hypothetical protein
MNLNIVHSEKSNLHHISLLNIKVEASRLLAKRQRQGFLASITWVRTSACTPVILVVFYLSTGLAGCSVDPGISCGARKLTRTPRVTKKNIYIKVES